MNKITEIISPAFVLLFFLVVSHSCTSGNTDEQEQPKYFVKAFKGWHHVRTKDTVYSSWDTIAIVPIDSLIYGDWYQVNGNYYPLNDTPSKIEIYKR